MACKGYFQANSQLGAPYTAVWAHRGRGGEHPDNTVAAFEWARRTGADGVELDVHLTADGIVVVHHDPVVAGAGPIAALDVARLPADVPSLAAALAACGNMVVNVEIKPPSDERGPAVRRLVDTVVRVVADAGRADRVVVSSFSTGVVEAVGHAGRQLADPVRLGWLIPPVSDPHTVLEAAAAKGFDCVHPFVTWVDEALVDRARHLGVRLHVWTVNNDDDLRAMAGLGVDAVITDRPVEALGVIRGR